MKYIFNMVCSEDKVGEDKVDGDSSYKKVKLVENQGSEKKTIALCGPYIGAYSILQKSDGKEFFEFVAKKVKYNFREGNFCDSWTDEKNFFMRNIPRENVKLKVILDDDCEYKIAVSIGNNKWILPKPALLGENLNLKGYYNQELKLSKGEIYLGDTKIYGHSGKCYIAQVMYGQTKICELAPFGLSTNVSLQSPSTGFSVKDNTIAVEKNDEGKFEIYLADGTGNRLATLHDQGSGNIVNHVNSSLKAILLENSNIREVLPELEIDDSVNLDKRKLKCLISKMHNADLAQVAQELITNKANELGQSIL